MAGVGGGRDRAGGHRRETRNGEIRQRGADPAGRCRIREPASRTGLGQALRGEAAMAALDGIGGCGGSPEEGKERRGGGEACGSGARRRGVPAGGSGDPGSRGPRMGSAGRRRSGATRKPVGTGGGRGLEESGGGAEVARSDWLE